MSNANLTSISYVFKHLYDGLVDEAMRLHPTLEMIPKQGEWTGDNLTYSVKVANAQNIASTIAGAQAIGSSTKGVKFSAIRQKKVGTISIDGETMLASRSSAGAFTDAVTNEVDGFLLEFMDRLGFDLFRDATGNRGQISVISTNTITFVTQDDARNWKPGQVFGAAQNANGTSPRVGTTTVTNVDYDAGTIVLTSAAAVASLSVNDFCFTAVEAGTYIEGMELCTPLASPVQGSDSFRGIDRTVATALLAGSRLSDTLTTPEENAGRIAVKIQQQGGRADTLVLNSQKFWELSRRLNAKVMYQGAGGSAEYGFENLAIASPAGMLRIVSDPDCPVTRGRVFLNASHKLRTLDELVHVINDDGNYNLRLSADDGVETRIRTMANYIQMAPRNHGVFQIL